MDWFCISWRQKIVLYIYISLSVDEDIDGDVENRSVINL
jgi:hypothetical protein